MDENTISMYKTVKDRNGKKHKVFSVRFKDVQTVTSFTEKYSPEYFTQYLLAPVFDEEGVVKDKDGNIDYGNGFYEDLVEVILLALDNRETREQVDEWLDMTLAREIIYVFLDLSTMKKDTENDKKGASWDRLFASIVSNTSMTMEDIGNLRVNQLEGLLNGINENAEEMDREFKGEKKPLQGDDAIRALMG